MNGHGENVGALLEGVVVENEITLPTGVVLTPVAVDMRGGIDEGKISCSLTQKSMTGVIYHLSKEGKIHTYNFRVNPFTMRGGYLRQRGSLHPLQIRRFECSKGCGMYVDMDLHEEQSSKAQGAFFCGSCKDEAGAPAKYPLRMLKPLIPEADPTIVEQLKALASEDPAQNFDVLMNFYGFFTDGRAPGAALQPQSALDHEAVSRAAAKGLEIRPLGEVLKMQQPFRGLQDIVGVARPIACGWVAKESLQTEDGFKRLYPLDLVRSKPREPRRFERVDATI